MLVLDLFAGIGGFSLGLERAGMETVAFCETDEFCRRVLAKHWPGVPIYEDVRELTGDAVGPVDIVTGGYPCQPFSLAGQRHGEEDDRHLWPEMRRLVAECRPTWVLGENVVGHISMGLDGVLSDLEALEYACRTFVIPACAVDAPHRRARVWIVAHADRRRLKVERQQKHGTQQGAPRHKPDGCGEGRRRDGAADVPDASGSRLSLSERETIFGARGLEEGGAIAEQGWWSVEPDVGRVAHGVPARVDRLKALGNAVVPQVAEMIGRAIMEADRRP